MAHYVGSLLILVGLCFALGGFMDVALALNLGRPPRTGEPSLIEGNWPGGGSNLFWGLISNARMVGLGLSGRLGPELNRAGIY